jgi:predicted nucleotidyltransferase component of viral defense system
LISRQEIMDFSREFGLSPNIVEKDYLLGWILAGISNHGELGAEWIFKGGTCLKKCYFETYRFSEDLDFTVKKADHCNQEFLRNAFEEVADWIYERAGIDIPRELIHFEIYANPRGKLSAQGRISYRGPLQPKGDLPRVKLDLTDDEILVLDQANRDIHHPYSDRPEEGFHILCYCFEELFAEKIRALGERLRPRDLYDVIHLYRHDSIRPDRALVLRTLEEKCRFKDIPIPTMEILDKKPERNEIEVEWGNMLGHQLPVMIPFEQFWMELPKVFDWLYRSVEKVLPPPMPLMGLAVDEAWRPPAMARAWHSTTPLEVIRFAAANRLCVDLKYGGTHRLIEPYSLRQTRDGNLLLYAVKHNTGEDRSYRTDRIQSAEVTKLAFKPRYVVELTASGPISAPPTVRGGISKPIRATSIRPPQRRRTSSLGPKYIFECPLCGKRFAHKSYESSLNKHKDKQGYPCPGTFGIYVNTKY